jgi:hypothetical protein
VGFTGECLSRPNDGEQGTEKKRARCFAQIILAVASAIYNNQDSHSAVIMQRCPCTSWWPIAASTFLLEAGASIM